jgi:flagellar assembly protein FliH
VSDGAVQPFLYADTSTVGSVDAALNDSAHGAQRESMAWERGRQEGAAEARTHFEKELATCKAVLLEALQAFAREREAFYEKVEGEVVTLALSIARKILHRETQVDPLLLLGMVRVALEKIEASTKVMLRVHPQRAAEWREYFGRSIDVRDIPEIVDDPGLMPDRCILETQLGTTELGWEVQFKEIEQGLLDLLAERPKALP